MRNHSNQKQQFSLILADGQIDTAGHKKSEMPQLKQEKSCKDWITLSPPFFDLNPNESFDVKVVMTVPPGQNTTRWAMIYVTAAEEQTSIKADKQMKAGLEVKPRIGVRVIQSPKSNTNYGGAISDLKEITGKQDSLRTFQAKVSNTGDKVIDAKVFLVLSNLETARDIKAKPVRVSVYPGNSKKVMLTMPPNVPPGKYSMAAILDFGNNSALEAVQMPIEIK